MRNNTPTLVLTDKGGLTAGCTFIDKGRAPLAISFFIPTFGSRDGRDVTIYGYICIHILILMYRLHNMIFSMPIPKSCVISQNEQGARASPSHPLVAHLWF